MIRRGPADRRRRREGDQELRQGGRQGRLKVMSKMGISTAQSYCGAQIFEAIGLSKDVIDKYFTWTPSRIGGIGLDVIAAGGRGPPRPRLPRAAAQRPDARRRRPVPVPPEGEYHLFNPETIHKLQHACRTDNYEVFKEYSKLVDDQAKRLCTLRGLLELKLGGPAGADRGGRAGRGDREALQDRGDVLRLDQQGGARDAGHRHEPHRRQEQHRRGRRGPGPLHPRRTNGDSKNSAIKQVASGRFGVTSDYLVNAQGAADQDGPGRQAGRGRPAARAQGLSVDRQGAPLDAGRRPDLAAAAPRHLLASRTWPS